MSLQIGYINTQEIYFKCVNCGEQTFPLQEGDKDQMWFKLDCPTCDETRKINLKPVVEGMK
jgi:DNA-directed RNA polymerase subunit RPC12/RpoP